MNPDPNQLPQTPTPNTPPEPEQPILSNPNRTIQPLPSTSEFRPEPTTPVSMPPQPDTPVTPVEAPAMAQPIVSDMPQPVISGAAPIQTLSGSASRSSKKRKLLLIGVPFVVVLLAAGAVFGLYLPNTPSSVWNTSVNRTGKALDSIVASATESKQLESYKSSQITGTITATFNKDTFSGDLSSKYDEASSDSGLNVTLKSSDGTKKIGAQLLTQTAKGSVYPDLYIKVSGLKEMGLDALSPEIAGYDNRWIIASSDYLKSISSSLTEGDEKKQAPVTAADTAEAARAVSKVTREYVFSTAKDKAVFVKKRFVAKEKIDGATMYHYKVSVNTEHAQAYCEAVSATVIDSKVYKKLTGADAAQITKDKQKSKTSCADNTKDSLKSSDEYDLWVDGKYKLIHKIRQYDKNSTTEYTDLGQNYKGDDEVSLFLDHVNTKDGSSTKTTLGTNLKTNVTSATFTYTNGDKANPINVKASFTMKPLTGKLQTTKPTDAVPLQDVLNKLGFSDFANTSSASMTTGGIQGRAEDSQRQADISALQTHIEAYFAMNNSYPTLANINSASWRSTNMRGVDAGALTDPSGTSATLASAPVKYAYSYQPTGCTASGCTDYTLTAILSDGTSYKKTALD